MKSLLIYEDGNAKIIQVPDDYFYEYLLIPVNDGRMVVTADEPKKKPKKSV